MKNIAKKALSSSPDRLLQYELTPIADLHSAERNARQHGPSQIDALADSVTAFGIINPVIIDGRNHIVAGHGRVEAAKRAGRTSIATLRVTHLSASEVRLYAITDNRTAERSVPRQHLWPRFEVVI